MEKKKAREIIMQLLCFDYLWVNWDAIQEAELRDGSQTP